MVGCLVLVRVFGRFGLVVLVMFMYMVRLLSFDVEMLSTYIITSSSLFIMSVLSIYLFYSCILFKLYLTCS